MKETAIMVRDREIKGLGLKVAGAVIEDPALARQLVAQGFAVWRQPAAKGGARKGSAGKDNRAPSKDR